MTEQTRETRRRKERETAMLADYLSLAFASEVARSGTTAARGFVDRHSMKSGTNLNRISSGMQTSQKRFMSKENNLLVGRN
jgi:hypothetical protein